MPIKPTHSGRKIAVHASLFLIVMTALLAGLAVAGSKKPAPPSDAEKRAAFPMDETRW